MALNYYWEYVGSFQFLNLSASVLWAALLHTAESQKKGNIFYSLPEIFYSLQQYREIYYIVFHYLRVIPGKLKIETVSLERKKSSLMLELSPLSEVIIDVIFICHGVLFHSLMIICENTGYSNPQSSANFEQRMTLTFCSFLSHKSATGYFQDLISRGKYVKMCMVFMVSSMNWLRHANPFPDYSFSVYVQSTGARQI